MEISKTALKIIIGTIFIVLTIIIICMMFDVFGLLNENIQQIFRHLMKVSFKYLFIFYGLCIIAYIYCLFYTLFDEN